MDVPEENVSHNNDINGLKEFKDSSDYIEPIEENVKDNVNNSALKWPLRHNNDTEDLAFSFNGFKPIKKPRYTYAGRISRVPSRYLDSDSDSSNGSARKDIVSRLKVKRRRKLSSTNKKSLANGFKEHDEKFSLKLNADTIICNLKEKERESLTNLGCSEVFEDISPISEDTISHITYETQARKFFPINNTPSEALNDCEDFFEVKVNGILESNDDTVSKLGLKNASVCCLEATGDSADISTENKGLPRFNSRMLSSDQSLTENHRDKEASDECKDEQGLENLSTKHVSRTKCKRALESCDSSTIMDNTIVSSIQISKQRKVSCASLVSNDSDVSSRKGNDHSDCLESAEASSANGCLVSEIESAEERVCRAVKGVVDLSKEDAVLSEACLEKSEILTNKIRKEGPTSQKKGNDCGFKPKGLNCFNNFSMKRKYYRRTAVNSNSNHGVIGKLKRKPVDKVKKAIRLQKKITANANNKKDVQNVNQLKTSFSAQELDRVLGMRRNAGGVYEFLVQWTNGTSCWVSSDQIVSNKHNYILREYLVENEQDVSVINRIPFQAYCCDSLSLKECKPQVKTKSVKQMLLGKSCPTSCKTPKEKKEVTVENCGDHCYITVNRESCKQKLTCVKIITELITALEDASVSECQMVIIKGVGSKVFGGLNLDIVCKASVEEKANMMLSKMRYLVQTLSNYPKPLVGLISKPAEGIGAVFLSLFDLIWDEDAWEKMQADENVEELSEDTSLYCMPRVLGHSIPSEEILMGKECEKLQASHRSCISSSFAKTICNGNGHSTVMSTLKEVETTLQNLGKRTSLLDINGEDIFQMAMNQSLDDADAPGSITTGNCAEESEIEGDSITPGTDFCPSTSSAPTDRYVKELENQIFQEKQLAQKYFKEIFSIWKDPNSVLSRDKC